MPFEIPITSSVAWSASQFARDVDWPEVARRGYAVYRGVQMARRMKRKFTRSSNGRFSKKPKLSGGASGNQSIPSRKGFNAPAVTQFHEAQTIYRRRGAPRRVKSRARKFARRATKAITNLWPTCTFQFYNAGSVVAPAGAQGNFWIPLLSGRQVVTSATGLTQQLYSVQRYFDYARSIQNTALNSGPSQNNLDEKFIIKNAVLDLVLYNPTGVSVLAKVYHLWARKDSADDPPLLYSNGIINKVPYVGTTGTSFGLPTGMIALSGSVPNVTPFDSTLLCERAVIKSTREFHIAPGQNVALNLRDRREYTVDPQEYASISTVTAVSGTVYPFLQKYTEGYFIQFYSSDQLGTDASTLDYVATINIRAASPDIRQAIAVQVA